MRIKNRQEINELKERFAEEVSAVRNYTKVIQVWVAGMKEGKQMCEGNQVQNGKLISRQGKPE